MTNTIIANRIAQIDACSPTVWGTRISANGRKSMHMVRVLGLPGLGDGLYKTWSVKAVSEVLTIVF
jgi:hypothetical protein